MISTSLFAILFVVFTISSSSSTQNDNSVLGEINSLLSGIMSAMNPSHANYSYIEGIQNSVDLYLHNNATSQYNNSSYVLDRVNTMLTALAQSLNPTLAGQLKKDNSTVLSTVDMILHHVTNHSSLIPPDLDSKIVEKEIEDILNASFTNSSSTSSTEKEPDSFLYKFGVGMIFAVIPCIVVFSFKNICPEFDRSMNMRRIILKGGGHKFQRLSQDENEAELEGINTKTHIHTATDDWDEFLGDRKTGSSHSSYVSFVRGSPNGSPPNEVVSL